MNYTVNIIVWSEEKSFRKKGALDHMNSQNSKLYSTMVINEVVGVELLTV